MGKNLMDDFVKEDLLELDIPDRTGFKYKPVTAGQENEWLKEYWKIDIETKKGYQDFGELNKCKMKNLVEVPYGLEQIKQLLGVEKTWEQLNTEERWSVLQHLKPKVFNQIIEAIEKIDSVSKTEVKN